MVVSAFFIFRTFFPVDQAVKLTVHERWVAVRVQLKSESWWWSATDLFTTALETRHGVQAPCLWSSRWDANFRVFCHLNCCCVLPRCIEFWQGTAWKNKIIVNVSDEQPTAWQELEELLKGYKIATKFVIWHDSPNYPGHAFYLSFENCLSCLKSSNNNCN